MDELAASSLSIGQENVTLLRFKSLEGKSGGAQYGAVQEKNLLCNEDNTGKELTRATCRTMDETKSVSCGRYEGIVWSIVTGSSCVLMASSLKYLKEFHAAELTFYCYLFCSVFSLPLVPIRVRVLRVERRVILMWVLTWFAAVGANLCRTAAFQMLPLGDASAIIFSTPFVTALFARIILKEKLSGMAIISLILAMLGLCLTVKLPEILTSKDFMENVGTVQHIVGCSYAAASVVCTAGVFIIMRSLKAIDAALNTFVNALGVTVLCGIIASTLYGGFHQLSCSKSSIIFLSTTGLSNFVMQITAARALQKEDPTTVATISRSADIILSFIVQITIFGDPVDAYSVSGALLVFSCGLLVPIQRWMESLPEDSRWKLNCLLR